MYWSNLFQLEFWPCVFAAPWHWLVCLPSFLNMAGLIQQSSHSHTENCASVPLCDDHDTQNFPVCPLLSRLRPVISHFAREEGITLISLLKIERLFLWFTRVLHCKSRHIIISYHISCDVYNFARQLAVWTRPFRHFVKARGIVGTAGRTRRRRWVRTTTRASNEEGVGSEAPGKDEEWCRKINGSRKCPRRSTRILLVETYTMNKQYVLICFVHLFTVFASKMKY